MNFGKALEIVKDGGLISREGWNGKGMFVFLIEGGDCKVQMDCVKTFVDQNGALKHNPYLAIKNVNGTISTWVPSVNDCLADDWLEINNNANTIVHIEKMKKELDELEIKLENLEVFLDKEIKEPKYTDEVQRIKLACQAEHMHSYAELLKERINYDSIKNYDIIKGN